MNSNNKNNLLAALVVLVIIANIIVIALFFKGREHNMLKPPGTPLEFLIKRLSLNEKQQEELHQLADSHHRAADSIRGKIKVARDQLFSLLKQPSGNDSSKNRASALVAKNLEELELLTFDHFQKVRLICTPVQQIKFDSIISQTVQMLGAPPPGGPPGPNNRDKRNDMPMPLPPMEGDDRMHHEP